MKIYHGSIDKVEIPEMKDGAYEPIGGGDLM